MHRLLQQYDSGRKALPRSSATAHCAQVTLLTSWNGFGIGGTMRLLKLLTSLTRLQHLDLAENDLYDRGAHAVAQARKQLPSLTRLDLGGNFIGSNGLSAVVEMCTGLCHLDLSMNTFDEAGLEELCAASKVLCKLTCLDLGGHEWERSAVAEATGALAAYPDLQHRGLQQRQRRRRSSSGCVELCAATRSCVEHA